MSGASSPSVQSPSVSGSDSSFEVDSPSAGTSPATTPPPSPQKESAKAKVPEPRKPDAPAPSQRREQQPSSTASTPTAAKKTSSSKRAEEPTAAAAKAPQPVSPSSSSSAATAQQQHEASQRAGSTDLDDESSIGVQHEARTVRVLTAEQFKRLFRSDIAGLSGADNHRSSPERPPQPSPRPSTAPRSGRRPGTAGSSRGLQQHRQPSARRDPYSGTRYGPMMANGPPPQPKAVAKLRKTVLRTAGDGSTRGCVSPARHFDAASPSRTRSAAGGSSSVVGGSSDEQALRLSEQVNAMQLQLTQRDKRIHQLMRQKGQLEQDNAHLSSMRYSRATATGQAQPADQVIIGLKARNAFLEEKLRLAEEDGETARHTTKYLRTATLQEQASTYLAEIQRLSKEIRERDRRERSGVDGAALAESQSVIAAKDTQLVHAQERNRALKSQVRAASDEAARCRDDAAKARQQAEEQQRRMDELKEAPAEVMRLRTQLQEAEERLADSQREIARLQGDRDTATQDVRKRDEHLSSAAKDRDALRAETEQLRLQLTSHEETAQQRIAKAVEAEKRQGDERVQEATLFAKDREAALRADAKELKGRVRELEAQMARQQQEHREEVDVLKAKEQQRQENMLRTMGAYERDRQQEQTRAVKDAEQRLAADRAALDRERAKWDAEAAERRKEIDELQQSKRRAEQEAAAAAQDAASKDARSRAPASRHHDDDDDQSEKGGAPARRKGAAPAPRSPSMGASHRTDDATDVAPNSFAEAGGADEDTASGAHDAATQRPPTAADTATDAGDDAGDEVASPTARGLTQTMLPADAHAAPSRYRHNDEVSDVTLVRADGPRHEDDDDTTRVSPDRDSRNASPEAAARSGNPPAKTLAPRRTEQGAADSNGNAAKQSPDALPAGDGALVSEASTVSQQQQREGTSTPPALAPDHSVGTVLQDHTGGAATPPPHAATPTAAPAAAPAGEDKTERSDMAASAGARGDGLPDFTEGTEDASESKASFAVEDDAGKQSAASSGRRKSKKAGGEELQIDSSDASSSTTSSAPGADRDDDSSSDSSDSSFHAAEDSATAVAATGSSPSGTAAVDAQQQPSASSAGAKTPAATPPASPAGAVAATAATTGGVSGKPPSSVASEPRGAESVGGSSSSTTSSASSTTSSGGDTGRSSNKAAARKAGGGDEFEIDSD